MLQEVLHSAHGGVRALVLNRPKAMNALNLNMIRIISPLIEVSCDMIFVHDSKPLIKNNNPLIKK